jgi:hypothetical protein
LILQTKANSNKGNNNHKHQTQQVSLVESTSQRTNANERANKGQKSDNITKTQHNKESLFRLVTKIFERVTLTETFYCFRRTFGAAAEQAMTGARNIRMRCSQQSFTIAASANSSSLTWHVADEFRSMRSLIRWGKGHTHVLQKKATKGQK